LRVFEAVSGKELSWSTLERGVSAVAISHDGRYVAAGSGDHTARVFDAVSGKELSRLAFESTVDAVAFSADGRYVAAASGDHTARVFDAVSGKELSRLTFESTVDAVAFSPNGRYLLTLTGLRGESEALLGRDLFLTRDLIDEACSRLTRNLTDEEWKRFMPGEEYRKTCPDLP
jgi:WD40 repeat protein